jgi:hypothetical protein
MNSLEMKFLELTSSCAKCAIETELRGIEVRKRCVASPRLRRPPRGGGLGVDLLFRGFEVGLDFYGHPWEVLHDFAVGEADDAQAQRLEERGAHGVSSQAFWGVMLSAVKLHDEFARGAVKIHDVMPDGSLPHPSLWSQTQTLIPKLSFRVCHPRPERLRSRRVPLLVRQPPIHPTTLQARAQPLSPSARGKPQAGGGPMPLPSHNSRLELLLFSLEVSA